MGTPTRILSGLILETFLIQFSEVVVRQQFSEWSPAGRQRAQTNVINVTRSHLAGFSETQIREEMFSSVGDDTVRLFYHNVLEILAKMRLTDPETREDYAPESWNACQLLDMPQDAPITSAEMESIAHAISLFGLGDYQRCQEFCARAADAFGLHLLYQLQLVAAARLGAQTDALGRAAKYGLAVFPWHRSLIDLTLGNAAASGLEATAETDNQRFQLGCFAALHAATAGDWEGARKIATRILAQPHDLPFEDAIVRADLERSA